MSGVEGDVPGEIVVRKSDRAKIRVAATCRCAEASHVVTVLDVSVGGLRIATPLLLDVGSTVELELRLGESAARTFRTRVVRAARNHEYDLMEYGMEIRGMSLADRASLLRFVAAQGRRRPSARSSKMR